MVSGEPARAAGSEIARSDPRSESVHRSDCRGLSSSSRMQWLSPPAHSVTISSMKLGELASRLGAELRGDAESGNYWRERD